MMHIKQNAQSGVRLTVKHTGPWFNPKDFGLTAGRTPDCALTHSTQLRQGAVCNVLTNERTIERSNTLLLIDTRRPVLCILTAPIVPSLPRNNKNTGPSPPPSCSSPIAFQHIGGENVPSETKHGCGYVLRHQGYGMIALCTKYNSSTMYW